MPGTAYTNPLISIVIPCYNAERYLSECLDSVLRQSERAFEIIAIDDASIDGTPLVLKRYAERDSRVKYYRFDENGGPSAARNYGIDLARGTFLYFIDSDDFIIPNTFKILLEAALKDGSDIVRALHYFYF